MKKIFAALSLVMMTSGMFAQDKFYTDWYMQLQGGVGHTVGETEWTNLISPAASLSLGYQATPTFGLRLNANGWEGMGYSNLKFESYKFNFGQLALDATFDLCNLIGGYKSRAINPYLFAGIGGNYRFNNGASLAMLPEDNYYWEDPAISLAGRAGAGIDFRVAPYVTIGLEVLDNMVSDHFNSKVGDNLDNHWNALLGVKFSLGSAKKQAAADAAAAAAAAAAAKEAARLEAEKKAQEEAARQRADQEREQAARAAQAAREAQEKAAAEQRAKDRAVTENVLFKLDRWNIRKTEDEKIDHVLEVLNKYPEAVVGITGYADHWTGTPKWNMTLSEKRANAVAKRLIEAGVDESRITKDWKGSEENPFETPELNRVAVIVTK